MSSSLLQKYAACGISIESLLTKITKPAERVVVLEWMFTEDLIALGVQSVGNAANANYKLWVAPEAKLASKLCLPYRTVTSSTLRKRRSMYSEPP